MLVSELDDLARIEALLVMLRARSRAHATTVITHAAAECPSVITAIARRHPGRSLTSIQSALVALEVPLEHLALGRAASRILVDAIDVAALDQAGETKPELTHVEPLPTNRLELGLESGACDGRASATLRARVVARSLGLSMWLPVAFEDESDAERFVAWASTPTQVREALKSVLDGRIRDENTALVAAMVSDHRLSDVRDLLEADPRVLTAFAEAAASSAVPTATVSDGVLRMLAAHYQVTALSLRDRVEAWASGQEIDETSAVLCMMFRENLEIAQTYRMLAP